AAARAVLRRAGRRALNLRGVHPRAPFFCPYGCKMNYLKSDYFTRNDARRLLPVAAAVLMLVLAGCAPLPPKDPAPTFAGARVGARVAEAPAPAASAPSAKPAPGDYGDAQLSRLIALALQDSPTMAVAQARVRQADAAAGQTQAAAGASL